MKVLSITKNNNKINSSGFSIQYLYILLQHVQLNRNSFLQGEKLRFSTLPLVSTVRAEATAVAAQHLEEKQCRNKREM